MNSTQGRFVQACLTFKTYGWVLENSTGDFLKGAQAKAEIGKYANACVNTRRGIKRVSRKELDCHNFNALLRSKVKRGMSVKEALLELLVACKEYPKYARRVLRKRHIPLSPLQQLQVEYETLNRRPKGLSRCNGEEMYLATPV